MLAYWFRFVNDDGEPTGYMGLVSGYSHDDIYLQIDEFGDPGRVEIQTAKLGGVCWKETPWEETCTGEEFDRTELEITEMVPNQFESKGWRKPKWQASEEEFTKTFLRVHTGSESI
jgi:hypothetical protein